MKNLTILYQSTRGLLEAEGDCPEIIDILASNPLVCTDPDNDSLYILHSNQLYVITFKKDLEITAEKNINIDINAKPVGIEYWSDHGILYCAYDNGDVIKISPTWPYDQELITHIDDGLKCMKISPDQEILILVTGNDNVITMMSSFEIITTTKLTTSNFGEQQFITAGWGHKETQFHGTEGKAAAKTKTIIIGKTDNDSYKPWITWRGDGTLFAISFFHKENDTRLFKVFNREGILQYTSELTNGLEEYISWKPSGSLIATTQRLPNKYVVALFEKNGLKHREFILPYATNEIEVKSLNWSPDSEILAVWFKKNNSNATILQLWTENNYHWYLKQTIDFNEFNPLIYFMWSTVNHVKKRMILLTKEKLIICVFRWRIDKTRGKVDGDKAVVGVVDGDKALLTGFKMGIVPPPMCHQSLQINAAINEYIFAPACTDDKTWLKPNTLFCLLQNYQLALFIHVDDDLLQYKHIKTYKIEWDISEPIDKNDLFSLHHFLWLNNNVILCSASSGNYSYLCVLELENIEPENNNGRIVVREALVMDDHIHHIVSSPDINAAYLIVGGHVSKYTHGAGVIPTEIIIPELCDHVEVVEIEKRHVVVALGCKNRLFIDGADVANNITSLCIHSHFLLLTTLQHVLVSVTMNGNGFGRLSMSNLSIKSWTDGSLENGPLGLSMRRLERGSSLVTVIPEDAKAILQMPRGNLEIIQPRALSFVILKTHLNIQNYFKAFDIMRKQRINLNLIYDHNPNLFMANAEKFIDEIKNPAWLNLFISELSEDDVTETIYQSCYSEEENNIRKEFERPEEGKVEKICQLLRKIMEKKATIRNLVQPILTCLVKNKHIAGLEAALRKIKEFKIKEGTVEGRQQSAEEALKYLLYLMDVNVLYEIALGMYDLELAKFVASRSLMDPKEYIPYLQNLSLIEENYRKFKIDKDLKRYDSALNNIAKCHDKFNECINLICEHNLYTKAIKLFANNTNEYKQIAQIYGEFLLKNKKYREAGIMFSRSNDLIHALMAYNMSGSWQDSIIVSTSMNMSPGELNELHNDLVNKMRDEKRYRDAAEIALTYLQQPEEAVAILSEGREWRDALRIAKTFKRLDLIETHINPGVHEHAIDIYFRVNKNKEEFSKYRKRLIIVRREKEKREAYAAELFGDDEENKRGLSDLLSETSSVMGSTTSLGSKSSRSSGKSYRSSKNRRKQERKVLSIKEGSAFEDLALIRALHLLITMTYTQRDEIVAINRVLLIFNYDELAEKLQNAMLDLLNIIEKYKHEIWPRDMNNQMNGGKDSDDIDSNMPHLLLEPKYTYAPEIGTSHWMLDIFAQPIKNIFK